MSLRDNGFWDGSVCSLMSLRDNGYLDGPVCTLMPLRDNGFWMALFVLSCLIVR
jgi:hypothetical protein